MGGESGFTGGHQQPLVLVGGLVLEYRREEPAHQCWVELVGGAHLVHVDAVRDLRGASKTVKGVVEALYVWIVHLHSSTGYLVSQMRSKTNILLQIRERLCNWGGHFILAV